MSVVEWEPKTTENEICTKQSLRLYEKDNWKQNKTGSIREGCNFKYYTLKRDCIRN